MDTMRLVVVVVCVAAAGAIFAWVIFRSGTHAERIRRARFVARQPLDDALFYERHYGSSGLERGLVVRLRHEIASALGVEAPKILPTDRFHDELSVARGWEYLDDGADELFLLNRDRQTRLGVTIPWADVRTVDDYIRTVAKFESGR